MTQVKHTPTPWDLSNRNVITFGDGTTQGEFVARIEGDRQEANASFIIKAVNSHEALVEACKSALRRLPEEDLTTAERQIKKDLEKALKQAEAL